MHHIVLVKVHKTVPYGLHAVNMTVSVNSCYCLLAPHTRTEARRDIRAFQKGKRVKDHIPSIETFKIMIMSSNRTVF